jgi:PKD repeat protein
LWQFGDGITSTLPSPSYTYTTPGIYTVTLAVNGAGGADTLTQTNYITVFSEPQIDFSASLTAGVAPATVVFTNTSSGDYIESMWDFGDGITSTVPDPSHTYTTPGIYTVTLGIDGLGGMTILSRTNYLNIYAPLVASFTAPVTTGVAPLSVEFTNLSDGENLSSLWDFGDGLTSIQQTPVHTYTQAGRYTVTLTISGLGGTDVTSQTNYVVIEAAEVDKSDIQIFLPMILKEP